MENHKNTPEEMKRLPFKLPDFFRLNWVSEAARDHWAPIIQACRSLIPIIEIESVAHGLRPCALIPVPLLETNDFRKKIDSHGLANAEIYRFSGATGYSSEANPATPNTAMVAIGTLNDVRAIKQLSDTGNTSSIGRFLGYPLCCCDFFQSNWNEKRFIDTTWPMAANTRSAIMVTPRELKIDEVSTNNMLLRWLGVRPVFHLPCSFDCLATREISFSLRTFAETIGYGDQMKKMHEILDWPVRWSALHGIAEIETPVFRLATKTDASAEKYIVDFIGTPSRVEFEASGLRFPYSWPKSRHGIERKLKVIPIARE